MTALAAITVNATSGSTLAIAAGQYRQELLLRCSGARAYIGFNEPARVNYGIWIDDGEGIVIARPLCQANIYFVCATTATVYPEAVTG